MYNGKNLPSRLLDNAVTEFAKLPGIGNKTALRLVLHLLRQDEKEVRNFSKAITELRENIKHCTICNTISDSNICDICSNPTRNKSIICVVENIKDVLAIENTHQYTGSYHVLGAIISPMDGIGPNDLNLESLDNRMATGEISEIILALSTTIEGDTTNFYIYKRYQKYNVPISVIARGIAFGDEIEYTDEITLGRSITGRTLFENTISK